MKNITLEKFLTLPPGIYQGISNEVYHGSQHHASASYLKRLNKTPAHAKTPQKDTKAMFLGRALHVLTLEGEAAFAAEFIVTPDGAPKRPTPAQMNAAKPSAETIYACDWWQSFNMAAAGKTVLSGEEAETCRNVRESVLSHPFAKLLLHEGVSESTVIFEREVLGQKIPCKCRPDRTPATSMRTLIDLKSCEDAGEEAFLYSCRKYGYLTQAAFYIDGYNAARGSDDPEMDAFVFIACEKEAPYRVECYTVDMDYLLWGRGEYQRLLTIEAQCRANNSWPAWTNAGCGELFKPAWLA